MSKRTYYANIYPPVIGSCGSVYATRELADQFAGRDRLACVPFEVDDPDAPAGARVVVTPIEGDKA
jgi:hypothetical protein